MAAGVFLILSSTAPALSQPTITTFDPPGSTETDPQSISNGAITGSYRDASNVAHGFVRAPDGTITAFDPVGSNGTFGTGINKQGAIAGSYQDASGASHGFTRTANGTITAFDPPGSVRTIGNAINNNGAIAGYYLDAGSMFHGFARAPDGTFTAFDPTGSAGTFAWGINNKGAITGLYSDNVAVHGFGGVLMELSPRSMLQDQPLPAPLASTRKVRSQDPTSMPAA